MSQVNINQPNKNQQLAIDSVKGPVKIIAGPGTGKTYTLVKRVSQLLLNKVKPEEIFVTTFTRKAAKELISRISEELEDKKLNININNMYVGTFNSLCLRIIDENSEGSPYEKKARMVEGEELLFMVKDKFNLNYEKTENGFAENKEMEKYSSLLKDVIKLNSDSKWRAIASAIIDVSRRLTEQLIYPEELISSPDENEVQIGNMLRKYQKMLIDLNAYDYATSQLVAYELLDPKKPSSKKITEKVKYIMVDEYQDTNYIQEQLVKRLGNIYKNICIVGDDDQGLYRFRGATVENIINFKGKEIKLEDNYRSEHEITAFSNLFMECSNIWYPWEDYRIQKNIKTVKQVKKIPSVLKITPRSNWEIELVEAVKNLKKEKVIEDYNQVAILFRSVKKDYVKRLKEIFEQNEVMVYSPNALIYYDQMEILLMIWILSKVFQDSQKQDIQQKIIKSVQREVLAKLNANHLNYTKEEVKIIQEILKGKSQVNKWIEEKSKAEKNQKFIELYYEILQFPPFNQSISKDAKKEYRELKKTFNLGKFSQILVEFEQIKRNLNLNTKQRTKEEIILFFNSYIRGRLNSNDVEYIPEDIQFPKDHISFLTIHQAKGLEFPIVITDIGGQNPVYVSKKTSIVKEIENSKKDIIEPKPVESISDFSRIFYTAFTRAQDILILTARYDLDIRLQELLDNVPEYKIVKKEIEKIKASKVKETKLLETYSYTGSIQHYQHCPRKYMFNKIFGFRNEQMENKQNILLGTLSHNILEDINKEIIDHKKPTNTKIEKLYEINREILKQKTDLDPIDPKKKEKIISDMQNYLENLDDSQKLKASEYKISQVIQITPEEKYILKGEIDLIKETKDNVIIVDFKTGSKEKGKDNPNYINQLKIYANLLKKYTDKEIKLQLYFLNNRDPIVDIDYNKEELEKVQQQFNETVKKIQNKEFELKERQEEKCSKCEFRFYCESK